MWIRSQNKRQIIKCEEIRIQYLNEHLSDEQIKMMNAAKGWGIMNRHHVLGFYSTEEKALKVLDMIKEIICEPTRIRKVEYALRPSEDYDIYNSKCFQMPKEDEVQDDL